MDGKVLENEMITVISLVLEELVIKILLLKEHVRFVAMESMLLLVLQKFLEILIMIKHGILQMITNGLRVVHVIISQQMQNIPRKM